MRRIRITVAYDGTNYHGWQVQPGLPAIQSELERVLSEIDSRPVQVAGSGRTDAGVHATGQVAAFDLANRLPCANLKKAMNRVLPADIRILDASEAAAGFHPRYQAVAKTYEYRIWRTEVCPPMRRLYCFHFPYRLDEAAMAGAAGLLVGEHDFSAFAASDPKDELGRSKVRTVFDSTLAREGDELVYRVRGSGFLKHMVRMIVGTLIEAGKGNLDTGAMVARLQAGYAGKAGPAAPARGLCLVSVEYADGAAC
jgi:tRNA pseudouridine38-40 synthase